MQLSDLTWPAVRSLDKDVPVIFPVAALEQHGYHLPLFTDSLLLGEIIRRTAERFPTQVLFAPLLWLGNSDHHLDFAGTLSAPPRTYLDLLASFCENFLQHGFRRLIFVNGHGGNDIPGRQTIFEVRQRHRNRNDLLLLFATYWNLNPETGQQPNPSFHQHEMGHACEWETSMILRIAPHLVGEISGIAPVPFGNAFEPASRAWITKERSVPGHIGSPHLATSEKGEILFGRFTDDLSRFLERVLRWDGKSWDG